MWKTEHPDPEEDLRQGDLLGPLTAPKLEIPFRTLKYPNDSDDQGDAVFSVQLRHVLVVSHCCNVEQGDHVALAPIQSTAPLAAEDKPAYFDEPSEDGVYVVRVHALDEIDGVIGHDGDRLKVANLERIMSLRMDVEHAKSLRIASMTPEGRRLLRIRLGMFWARAEPSDVEKLKSLGLPPGPHPLSESSATSD